MALVWRVLSASLPWPWLSLRVSSPSGPQSRTPRGRTAPLPPLKLGQMRFVAKVHSGLERRRRRHLAGVSISRCWKQSKISWKRLRARSDGTARVQRFSAYGVEQRPVTRWGGFSETTSVVVEVGGNGRPLPVSSRLSPFGRGRKVADSSASALNLPRRPAAALGHPFQETTSYVSISADHSASLDSARPRSVIE